MRRAYHRWTGRDAELLRSGYARGLSAAALATQLGTTAAAVRTRAQQLGIRHRRGARSLAERFMDHVSPEPCGCWLWSGTTDRWGYGQLRTSPRQFRYATHVALEVAGRPVPEGRRTRRQCDTHGCVNPAHLAVAA